MAKTRRKRHSENSDKRKELHLRHVDYARVQEPLKLQEFARWISLPRVVRKPKTHKEFAAKIGVSQDTLTDWKHLYGFWREVEAEQKWYFLEQAADVLKALTDRAQEGRAPEVKLFLQYFCGFSEKHTLEGEQPRELSPEERKQHMEILKRWGLITDTEGADND